MQFLMELEIQIQNDYWRYGTKVNFPILKQWLEEIENEMSKKCNEYWIRMYKSRRINFSIYISLYIFCSIFDDSRCKSNHALTHRVYSIEESLQYEMVDAK